MLYAQTAPAEKRRLFRERLASGELLRFPGAFNPLSARLIERKGFDGVYISGAVLSADLGLPDIGLTTLTEVAGRAKQIARMTDLPAIVDADTGFGEPMNVARTVQEMEDAGLAGLHIEDQVNPKRCGHLDGKPVVGEPGDLVKLPRGIPHGIFNHSEANAKCIFWVAPTQRLYDLFWGIHNLGPEADPAEVVALSAQHEVDFLPPPEES